MAMVRSRAAAGSAVPFRLLYSVREPAAVLYRDELQAQSTRDSSVGVTYAYTRGVPPGWTQPPRRINAALIASATWPASLGPTCYVWDLHRSLKMPRAFSPPAATARTGSGPSASVQQENGNEFEYRLS
jgi:ferredoxin-NADP reductase